MTNRDGRPQGPGNVGSIGRDRDGRPQLPGDGASVGRDREGRPQGPGNIGSIGRDREGRPQLPGDGGSIGRDRDGRPGNVVDGRDRAGRGGDWSDRGSRGDWNGISRGDRDRGGFDRGGFDRDRSWDRERWRSGDFSELSRHRRDRDWGGRDRDGRGFDGRGFDGRGRDGRDWHGRDWVGRFHDRHRDWHRGFAVNIFVNRPWGWSPWWGGWGGLGWGGFGGWGWGSGWGFGFPGFGLGGLGGFGGWGWADWWCPWGYAPLAFQTGYWGYANPYWQEPLVLGSTVVDYSQPIILLGDAAPEAAGAVEDPTTSAALARFEAARGAFGRGDYQAALAGAHAALEHLPTDAALHEFLSLVHFAQGNYRDAAGIIHSVLAVGPGWSWPTLASLYPDVSAYTQQLRAAEAYRRANPDAADVRFLLAYHYMTTGYGDAAARQLQEVLALEPNDTVATQLLEGLTGSSSGSPQPGDPGDAAGPVVPPLPTRTAEAPEGARPPAGSLVGSWTASRDDGSKFGLVLNDESRFTWTFTLRDQTSELSGKYSLADDLLVLEPEDGGAMIGRVHDAGENRFQFRLVGAPGNDAGLVFER